MTAKHVVHWRAGVPVKAYYEAGRGDRTRRQRTETGNADTAVNRAGVSIRQQARHLEQNHDLARGALNNLVQNTIGAAGIQIEPQPRDAQGKIIRPLAKSIRDSFKLWAKRPEVTGELSFARCQRLAARSWYRDGEVFAQHLAGNIPRYTHNSAVPYSIELVEADFVPLDYHQVGPPMIIQGVEKNAWNRPVAYYVYKEHPNHLLHGVAFQDLKRVPADRMTHVKLIDRIGQTRGVSAYAAVMLRLDDIKDYEESERIAAKVAASMAAYIKKGNPDNYDDDPDDDGEWEPREMRFRPGMVFDDLLPGEEIGTIDTTRPNTSLEAFRNSQLRAFAAGFGGTFSSIAKTYDGTFSAQRQELVEGFGAYQILAAEFTDQFVRVAYERWLSMAILSGQVRLPAGVDEATLNDALFIAPEMPWIDPVKEAVGWEHLINNTLASPQEIIRKRGRNPEDVLEQAAAWREALAERGMTDEPGETNAQDRTFLLQD